VWSKIRFRQPEHQPCRISEQPGLHAGPAGHLLVAVGAGVNHILAPVHTEGDQAAAKTTSNPPEDAAHHPGEGATLIVDSSHYLCTAVGAVAMHRWFSIGLHHCDGRLAHHHCVVRVSALLLGPRCPRVRGITLHGGLARGRPVACFRRFSIRLWWVPLLLRGWVPLLLRGWVPLLWWWWIPLLGRWVWCVRGWVPSRARIWRWSVRHVSAVWRCSRNKCKAKSLLFF